MMNRKFLKSAAMALVLSLDLATFARADAANQGGTIVVTYKDDMATLDPAIGYDWQNWSMINGLFSRLVDYKFGTTEIVPSLADSWTISPDGLVYTFSSIQTPNSPMAGRSRRRMSNTRLSAR